MLSHQVKDLDGPEIKKLKKKIESKEHVSKFFNTDEEDKQIEVLRKEEEIRGEENLKREAEEAEERRV